MRHSIDENLFAVSDKLYQVRWQLQQVLELTAQMVNLALHGQWHELLDSMDERAELMHTLTNDQAYCTHTANDARMIAALQAAVTESERALHQVIAHAVASTRWQGAEFSLRH